jgi:hypothetical protein
VKTLDVSATGGATASYTYDVTGNSLTNMNWTAESYTLLATSASTTVRFVSTTAGFFGPALDDVVITETVPTKADCKDGGWQTMIDNAGNHFKNQGDCVSYFATGGKNLGALPPVITANTSATTAGDAATSQVKHSTEGHHQATVQHASGPSGADGTKNHSGHRHGARSHHSN